MPAGGRCSDVIPWSRPAGAPGKAADPRLERIPVGAKGSKSTTSQQVVGEHEIASRLNPGFISMLLNAASRDYLNLNLKSAVERLNWLQAHLIPLTSPAVYSKAKGIDPKSYGSAGGANAAALYAAQQNRVAALLTQIHLGQDYFGEPTNYVTLLSESFYTKTLDRMLELCTAVEESYKAYDYRKGQDAKTVEQVLAAKQNYLQVVEDKRSEKSTLTDQHPRILATLKILDEERNSRWLTLVNSEKAFQEAVKSRRDGCSFGKLVGIAAACATPVASGGTALAALGAAGAVFADDAKGDDGKPIPGGLKGANYKLGKVEAAGKTLQSFGDAADKLNGDLEPKKTSAGVMQFPSDDSKILTTQEDLDKQLEQFLDMPQAQTYKQAIHEFTTTCVARNNKVIELNVLVNQLRKLDGETAQATIEADRLQNAMSLGLNPFFVDSAAFMERAWQDSLATVVRTLSRLHAAYKYYSLDDKSTIQINDFSVTSLKATALLLIAKYTNAKVSLGSPPSRIDAKTLKLSQIVGAAGIKRFQTTRRLTFSIDPDHPQFSSLSNVLVSGIDVVPTSSAGPIRAFDLTITHHGRGLMFDQGGNAHLYSHVPIRTPFTREGGRTTVFGDIGSVDYVGVSPYGPWTIELNTKTPIATLSEVTFAMTGFGRARTNRARLAHS